MQPPDGLCVERGKEQAAQERLNQTERGTDYTPANEFFSANQRHYVIALALHVGVGHPKRSKAEPSLLQIIEPRIEILKEMMFRILEL
jgi:hypothetical protein